MKLLYLEIKNFKGMHSFVLDTKGGDVSIYGENATGKTTLADSYWWLLHGKDSRDKKDFAIKTLDADGNPTPGLDHSVEAIFEKDGRQFKLKKVYSEKWTKKRGQAKAVFSGHTVDHFINGVPVKEKEYNDFINSIATEETFKILTSPTYFSETLPWQKRRQILLDVCGDVSDADVIASNPALAPLPAILDGRNLDEHRKIIAARRSEINKELDKIPVRIDEAMRALPDINGLDAAKLSAQLAEAKASLNAKQQELARVESGGDAAEKKRQLAELEGEIMRLRNEANSRMAQAFQEKQKEYNAASNKALKINAEITKCKMAIDSITPEIEKLTEKMDVLRERFFAERDKAFACQEQSTVCPTCGQVIPEEKLNEARQKASESFNLAKARRLEEINAEGVALKEKRSSLEAEAKAIEEKKDALVRELIVAENHASALKDVLEKLQKQQIPDSQTVMQKLSEKEALEKEISQLQEGNQEIIAALRRDIELAVKEIDALNDDLKKIDQREKGQERIEELKAEEKKLAAEFERLEEELHLCDLFIRAKVDMLEEKINSRFKQARFKLFNVQVNQGIEPCCEVLGDGVPFNAGLNNGGRIQIGMDIISTLCEHYQFWPPIWVDNNESVIRLPEMKNQVIGLFVTEDSYLKVVVKNKNELKEAI